MVAERARLAGGVGEDPAVPLDERQLHEAQDARVEAGCVAEAGRAAQRTVQAVRPGVVRADDGLLGGRCTARQQLVATMPTDVGEAAQHAVVAADHQDALRPGGVRPLHAGLGEVVAATEAASSPRRSSPAPRRGRRDRRTPPAAASGSHRVERRTGPRPAGPRGRASREYLIEHTVRLAPQLVPNPRQKPELSPI